MSLLADIAKEIACLQGKVIQGSRVYYQKQLKMVPEEGLEPAT